jgi:N-acetylglucosamine kinase-like BadF-type ATPase
VMRCACVHVGNDGWLGWRFACGSLLAATGCMVTVGTGTYCYGSGMDRTMIIRYRDFGAKDVANE